MASEAMPSAMVKPLKLSSTASPTSACRTRNSGGLPDADLAGRDRPRARCARPTSSRSRSTMSFQVQPAPRMAKAPMKNSTRCQEAGRAARARRPRPVPPTTSRASAAARSRSGGRGGTAADKDATRPARACRPNCRSRRRPNRPRESFSPSMCGLIGPADCRSACRRCRRGRAW